MNWTEWMRFIEIKWAFKYYYFELVGYRDNKMVFRYYGHKYEHQI